MAKSRAGAPDAVLNGMKVGIGSDRLHFTRRRTAPKNASRPCLSGDVRRTPSRRARLERVEVRAAARRRRSIGAKCRRCAEKARHDGFVFFRLARAGGVDQPAAGRTASAALRIIVQLRVGERREIGFGPPPADVGIAPDRAEARAWRVDEHHIELRRERQPRLEIGLQHADVAARRWRRPFRAAVARARCAHRPRRSRARSPAIAAIAVVLPPGDAQVSSTLMPGSGAPSSATSCDASSCRKNCPVPASGVRSGFPAVTIRPSGA